MGWDHDWDFEYEDQYDPHPPEGDPRRCPRHPGVATSSPDGLHDTTCGHCEHESYEAEQESEFWVATMGPDERVDPLPDDGKAPFAPVEAILHLRRPSWAERRTDPKPCG